MNEDEAGQLALKRAELLVMMSKAVNETSEELRRLRLTVKDNTGAREKDHRTLNWVKIAVILLLLYIPLQGYISVQNRHILNQIHGVITPGGKVYEQNKAATASEIQLLQTTNILIAQCQQDHMPDILACVTERATNKP